MRSIYVSGKKHYQVTDSTEELSVMADEARRNRIAENFAYALVASEAHHVNYIPSVAIDLADALIAELDK